MDEFFGVFLGYRKFILMLLLLIIGVAFRIENLIDGSQMVDLLKNTALAFIGGNAAEHFTGVAKEWLKTTTIVKGTTNTTVVPDNPDSEGGNGG